MCSSCALSQHQTHENSSKHAVAVYETVDTLSDKVELKENVAYGPVKPN